MYIDDRVGPIFGNTKPQDDRFVDSSTSDQTSSPIHPLFEYRFREYLSCRLSPVVGDWWIVNRGCLRTVVGGWLFADGGWWMAVDGRQVVVCGWRLVVSADA